MRITFRIPSGGGGMVQGMALGDLHRMLSSWDSLYGRCYTLTSDGYERTLTFDNDAAAVKFMLTFKPSKPHWWRAARIER